LGKVGGKLNAYVRDAISGPSYVIPPVNEYHGTQGGPVSLTAAEKMEKKKGRGPLTDLEIEDAIGDLFDYFNDTFGTLKQNLSSEGELRPHCSVGRRGADSLASFNSLGPRHHSALEEHPYHHRKSYRTAVVGSTHRDEDAQRQGGRHRVQMARRECLPSASR
jgi:hypothetical protein